MVCEKRGKYMHRKGCMSSIVNPVTEWVGGSDVIITGHECPECGYITFLDGNVLLPKGDKL